MAGRRKEGEERGEKWEKEGGKRKNEKGEEEKEARKR